MIYFSAKIYFYLHSLIRIQGNLSRCPNYFDFTFDHKKTWNFVLARHIGFYEENLLIIRHLGNNGLREWFLSRFLTLHRGLFMTKRWSQHNINIWICFLVSLTKQNFFFLFYMTNLTLSKKFLHVRVLTNQPHVFAYWTIHINWISIELFCIRYTKLI